MCVFGWFIITSKPFFTRRLDRCNGCSNQTQSHFNPSRINHSLTHESITDDDAIIVSCDSDEDEKNGPSGTRSPVRLPVATEALTGGGGLSKPMDVQHDIVYNNMDPFVRPPPLYRRRALCRHVLAHLC